MRWQGREESKNVEEEVAGIFAVVKARAFLV